MLGYICRRKDSFERAVRIFEYDGMALKQRRKWVIELDLIVRAIVSVREEEYLPSLQKVDVAILRSAVTQPPQGELSTPLESSATQSQKILHDPRRQNK